MAAQDKIKNIVNTLNSHKIPTTYHHWEVGQAPKLPFACVLVRGSDNFFADGVTYEEILEVDVELYTKSKDLKLESTIGNLLNDAGYAWNKSEEYIDDEKCYQITYTMEV